MYQIERQNRCILRALTNLYRSNNTLKTWEQILGWQKLFDKKAFWSNETAFEKNNSAFYLTEMAFCSNKTFRELVDWKICIRECRWQGRVCAFRCIGSWGLVWGMGLCLVLSARYSRVVVLLWQGGLRIGQILPLYLCLYIWRRLLSLSTIGWKLRLVVRA